jgi:mono/diheme cytochrome c family protein
MTSRARIASFAAAAAVLLFFGGGARADEAAAKKAFDANKCSNCHSIEKLEMARKIQSEKTAGPDLSKVGTKHDAAWIVKWCMREVEKDGKTHKSEYKGTKEDLQAVADWLATLK